MKKSMYMQMHQGKSTEDFSKNAVYRFLDNPKANWQKYTIELSADIIGNMLRDLTSKDRRDAFVIDDSLFDRSRSKNVEQLSRVFDHCGKGVQTLIGAKLYYCNKRSIIQRMLPPLYLYLQYISYILLPYLKSHI